MGQRHHRPLRPATAGDPGTVHYAPNLLTEQDQALFPGLSFHGSSSALSRVGAFLVEPGLVYEYHRLHAVAEAELGEDVRDVGLYGRLADVELLTDLCVGQAAGDEQEDVLLSCGELV